MVEDEPPLPEVRPSIRSNRAPSAYNPPESPRKELQGFDFSSGRPGVNRSTTFEGPTQIHRESSPVSAAKMARVPSDSLTMRAQRSQLRPISRINTGNDLFSDPSDDSTFASNSSPDKSYEERSQRSASPATSYGSAPSRSASYSTLNAPTMNSKKQAPPPPPSRAKKPPPPPPMKRSALSTTNMSYD